MNRPLKYSLIGVAALVVVLVAAVGVFVATFDANRYKVQAATAVRDATGRELTISGDLHLDLFPWLALRAGKVELGNAAGFDGPFASLEGFEAKVRVTPLLHGELQIGEVVLRGAKVALAVDAAGHDNWSDLASQPGDAGGATENAGVDAGVGAKPARRFSVAGVVIEGAALDYRDARDGSSTTLHDVELHTSSITATDPLEVEGRAGFALGAPALSGRLDFSFTRAADGVLSDLKLGLDAEGAALPAPLKGAKLTLVKLTPGEPLTVEQLHFEGWGLAVDGGLTLAAGAPGAPATLSGHLETAPFAPREVLPALGIAVPKTADPKALSRMALAFDLEHLGDRLTLDKLKLTLDDSTISGRVTVDPIAHKALRFELALDKLDADRYLPPPAPVPVEGAPVAGSGLDAIVLETAWLRGLDAVGTLHAGKLAVAKFDLSDLRVALAARDGRLTLKPFGAALYGGKVQGEAELDARGARPSVHLKLALAGVKIGDLLADGFDSKLITGKAKLDLDLRGAGAKLGEVKHALDGTMSFEVQDGALEGFNVWKQVRLAWAKLKRRETPAASDPDRTVFEELTGGATVVDGVATLADVRAAIQFADATAKGTVDLGAGTLKIEAKAKINAAPEFGPGENLTELKGVTLPLNISGPFAKPKVDVDLTKAATSLLKEDKLDALKKKLKGLHF